VTRPFGFEGKRRMMQAERGLQELLDAVDTVIVIPNEKLLAVAKDAGFFESFRIADDVLRQGVQGISDIITIPGIINRDFADVKTTMAGMGYAVMATGIRSGENRAREAAQAAMASPLLEAGAIDGARGILINITGSSTLKLSEVNEASMLIQDAAHEDANIIFGAVLDERLGDEVKITVIATGFKHQKENEDRRERMLEQSGLSRGMTSEGIVARPVIQPRYVAPVVSSAPPAPVEFHEKPQARTFAEVPILRPENEKVYLPGGLMDAASAPESVASVDPILEHRSEAQITPAPPVVPTSTYRDTTRDFPATQSFPTETATPPLVPVPASAFDDDFFRRDRRPAATSHVDEPFLRTDVRVPTFAGLAPAEPEPEHDDLDIPAFLRRGNS
ncbi:MAG: hypothetical protein ACRYGF_00820, partial [Janthinobacterium lividum]